MVLVGFAITFAIWRIKRQDAEKLSVQLKEARDLAQQRERERDLAQDELFRRLYEERELNKEKIQFQAQDRKSTRLNSSHANISYAVFCLKKKNHNKVRHS